MAGSTCRYTTNTARLFPEMDVAGQDDYARSNEA